MPQPELLLRFDVPLAGDLQFYAWVPSTESEALSLSLSDALHAHVWVPANYEFLPVTGDAAERTSFPCVRLRVQMAVTAMSDEVRSTFAEYDPRPVPRGGLEEFLRTVYENVVGLVNSICSFVRDELGQWRVQTLRPRGPGQLFIEANAVWSWNGVEWHPLRGPTDEPLRIVMWGPESCIDRDVWARVQRFVGEGSETEVTRHLASNARQLAHAREYRGAVLEAAIAIERECGLLVKRYLERKGLPTNRITGRDASTTVLLSVWLPLIRTSTEPAQLGAAKKVIQLRNQILHQAQRTVREDEGNAVWKAAQLAEELCEERLAESKRP